VLGNSNATFSNGERISSGSRLHSPSLTNIQHSLYFSSFSLFAVDSLISGVLANDAHFEKRTPQLVAVAAFG
jgi:hypothetical protein